MVYNGIVMDLISVMVSIGLLLLFLSRGRIRNLRISVVIEKEVVKNGNWTVVENQKRKNVEVSFLDRTVKGIISQKKEGNVKIHVRYSIPALNPL